MGLCALGHMKCFYIRKMLHHRWRSTPGKEVREHQGDVTHPDDGRVIRDRSYGRRLDGLLVEREVLYLARAEDDVLVSFGYGWDVLRGWSGCDASAFGRARDEKGRG